MYYAEVSGANLGHRFLVAAHETFQLLASQPRMGWMPRPRAGLGEWRVFRVLGLEKILILFRPAEDGIEVVRLIHGARDQLRLPDFQMPTAAAAAVYSAATGCGSPLGRCGAGASASFGANAVKIATATAVAIIVGT